MKKLFPAILVALFLINSTSILAQTWNQEQSEAWNVMLKVYDAVKTSDHDMYKSLLHEKFSMWFDDETFPSDRISHDLWEAYWMANTEVKIVEILPLKIIIVDNIGVIHHLARSLIKTEDKTTLRQAKWTDVMIKENNQWVLITSHGSIIDD